MKLIFGCLEIEKRHAKRGVYVLSAHNRLARTLDDIAS